MKFCYLFLFLSCLTPLSYGEANTPLDTNQTKGVMPKTYELTTQEKTDLKNIIIGAIKVINDNDSMEDQTKFLGEGKLFLPKSPKAPILKMIFNKDKLFTVVLNRISEQSPWTKATIFFQSTKLVPIEIKFDEKDFTHVLGLTFDKLSEHTIQHSAINGMEAYETKEYTFDYHWTLNNKIKVLFKVRPDDLLRNEKFPSNFTVVEVYRDK